MKVIDPTYLRSIHDGLMSGSVHKENTSALPLGLMGMYEEALPPSSQVTERKKFLEFFGVWALLKKEVSREFVHPLLEGWAEQEVINNIGKYSKWFNSPLTGKYVLYHERLRAFVLQKISHSHFAKSNESIIKQCQIALESKDGDEWERYALEHLSVHLLIQAMESKDSSELKKLAYSTSHWNRQIEISKGFEWSKSLLNDMMLWASKYDEEEVIECLLTKVDLHHQEQNDAPRIVELVAQNDIETALQRIETFGGNDQEGLQRKFILYMLCLMELTLLESKDKPFRKEAIEKLLKHLDDNLPVDHSVLNWNDFFPSYLMFQMACELQKLIIDFNPVLNKTKDWSLDWIDIKGPYSEKEFNFLQKIIKRETDEEKYLKYIKLILIEYCKQNKENKIKVLVSKISKAEYRDEVIDLLIPELIKIGKLDFLLSLKILIKEENDQNRFLLEITTKLLEKNQINRAKNLFSQFSYRYYKVAAICLICNYSYDKKIGDYVSPLNAAIDICKSIQSDSWLLMAKRKIASAYIHQRKFVKAQKTLQESFKLSVKSEYLNDFLLSSLVEKLTMARKFSFAEKIADKIIDVSERNFSYEVLLKNFLKRKEFELANILYQKIIPVNNHKIRWESILIEASKELLKVRKIKIALEIAEKIEIFKFKFNAFIELAEESFKQEMDLEAKILIEKAININFLINNLSENSYGTFRIVILLFKYAKDEEAFELIKKLNDDFPYKDQIKIELSKHFAKNQQLNNSFQNILELVHKENKNKALLEVFNITINLNIGYLYNALLFSIKYDHNVNLINYKRDQITKIYKSFYDKKDLHMAYIFANSIESVGDKAGALNDVSLAMFLGGNEKFDLIFKKSLYYSGKIEWEFERILIFKALFSTRKLQGYSDEAINFLLESIDYLRNTDEPFNIWCLVELFPVFFESEMMDIFMQFVQDLIQNEKSSSEGVADLLKGISIQWAEHDEFIKALSFARSIILEVDRIEALAKISTLIYKQNNLKDSALVIEEALKIAISIDKESIKNEALEQISIELIRQGHYEDALSCSRNVRCYEDKIRIQLLMFSELLNFDKFWEAEVVIKEVLDSSNSIFDELRRKETLGGVSIVLDKISSLDEILFCIRKITIEKYKFQALSVTSIKIFQMGNIQLAEKLVLEIPIAADRAECFEKMFKNILEKNDVKDAIKLFSQFKNQESQDYFLKILLNSISSIELSSELILKTRVFYQKNVESVENLLQKHALHELFFGYASPEKIQRFNRTLNIQWAIDIKNLSLEKA